jgi:Domain of unknown function (DUF4349)
MRPIAALFVTAVLMVAACNLAQEAPTTHNAVRADSLAAAGRPMMARVARAAPLAAPEQQAKAVGATDVHWVRPTPERAGMLIRTGQASIEVDSLDRAVAELRLLADRMGGYVANTTLQTGRGQLRAGTLELKIPADRFDEGLTGLAAIGKLESVNVDVEDVGEEFTDVSARMENARRLEARLLALLATRTGKLKDVLDVEQELARVREEIDRYEGRLRYLRAHVALCTLTISVHEPVPVVGHVGSSVMGEAFKQAWRNFVGLVALGIRALGFVVPLGGVAGVGWLALKRRRPVRVPA